MHCQNLIGATLILLLGAWFPGDRENLQGQDAKRFQKIFDTWDRNGDGKLVPDELPRNLRRNFERVDTNRDGFISREEDARFRLGNRKNRTAIPGGIRSLKDLPYVSGGHQRQKLDLHFHPEGKSRRPLVIWIHGGGWRAGSKDRCPALFLLEQGYAVASINYRLSQHAIFPAQIQDCKSAIAWLRQNAEKYNLDPDRFGVWGSSAGGHLSALVGTSANVRHLEPTGAEADASRVQAVCDWFGPTDVLKMNNQAGEKGVLDHDAADSPESQLVGGAIQENREQARKLNPIEYLSADDPPFLIMHGDRDFLVPIQQSQQLHAALQKAGRPSELVVIEGKGHGGFDTQQVRPQIIRFFDRHLKKKK